MKDEMESYNTDATYKEHVSFIEGFHNDFEDVLDTYVRKDRPVFVFIDDLDRCEVLKIADIMESIHLMLSEGPRLVFLLGMDREKVAGALAAKHRDLLEYLNTGEQDNFGLDYGNQYIEKFIQIPFDVPRIMTESIDEFVGKATVTEELSASDDLLRQGRRKTRRWQGFEARGIRNRGGTQ